jgi:hypothetical protein
MPSSNTFDKELTNRGIVVAKFDEEWRLGSIGFAFG